MHISLLFWIVMLLALVLTGLGFSSKTREKVPEWSPGCLYLVALLLLGWEVFGDAIKN